MFASYNWRGSRGGGQSAATPIPTPTLWGDGLLSVPQHPVWRVSHPDQARHSARFHPPTLGSRRNHFCFCGPAGPLQKLHGGAVSEKGNSKPETADRENGAEVWQRREPPCPRGCRNGHHRLWPQMRPAGIEINATLGRKSGNSLPKTGSTD